jgi:hypothetical protein
MATSPTEKTAQYLKFKTDAQAANDARNNIVNSDKYKELTTQVKIQEEAEKLAYEKADALQKSNASVEETYQARVALQQATDALKVTRSELDPLNSQATDLSVQSFNFNLAARQVQQSPQTTSPLPTEQQVEAEAKEAGSAAAKQPSPNPAPVLTSIPTESNIVPTLDTPVPADSLAAGGPTAEPTKTTPNDEPVFVFNQRQLNFLESYNQSLIDGGNPQLIISDLTSTEALNLLAEQGLIQSDEDSPTDQQPTEGYTTDGGLVVNIRGVGQREIVEYEEFQSVDPGFESGFPEEQITVDSSDRYVATLDLTATDDPLGDKIAELQAGQNTGTSTLPTRNQQSGIGSPKDWRFRISLAPGATYLYKDSSPGILKPLMATNGVIFPYSPQINLAYTANYNATDLVHTNYKVYNYKNSSVENISITGDFTVQDSAEANYVLAVIHFFRSVTKMFYGQDQNPARGVPPPLCYLTGFGQYQFDMHPVAITSFTYTFPNDVDYVNAYPTNNSVSIGGQNMAPYMPQIASFFSPLDRLRTLAGNIGKGGLPPPPTFVTSKNINEVTRVPAKITIQLSCIPIVSRNTMSNQFSLKQYANGSLLKGTANFSRTGGGLW